MNRYAPWIAAALVCLVALFASFTQSTAAERQPSRCGPHKEVVKFLYTKYNESRVGMGLVGTKVMVELYLSEEGSWSVIITDTNGTACFGPVGKDWQTIELKAPGNKS